MYRYFFSYMYYINKNVMASVGYGNCTMDFESRLGGMEDIDFVANRIKNERNVDSVVILYWQFF